MDEPLSNLDAKLRVQTRADLIRLHQRLQTTSIYVTHDQVEAMTMGTRIAVMLDGVLQQLDTPRTLYERPINAFVAGFIGSPAMNTLRMNVSVEGEEVRLHRQEPRAADGAGESGPGFDVSAPPPYRAALRPYAGREVIMGVRPEDLDERPRDESAAPLPARVDVIEPLGSEAYLYANVAGAAVVARLDPNTPARPGDHVTLYAAGDRLYFFDPETDLNIMLSPAPQAAGAHG
jgi:multiple sugar transport system ATP-binding protein